ncbi:hypothetical protein HPP92_028575, partial [Vanilla planifolia]
MEPHLLASKLDVLVLAFLFLFFPFHTPEGPLVRSLSRKEHCQIFGFVKEASAFWDLQLAAAQEHAVRMIIPACNSMANVSSSSKDLIEKELSTFNQSMDNRLYMMPSTPQ